MSQAVFEKPETHIE